MLCRTSSPPPPSTSPAGSEISVGSPSPPPIGSDSHPAHLVHPHPLAVTHLVHAAAAAHHHHHHNHHHHHPLVHPHHPHHPALHAHAAVAGALQARAEDYFTPLKRLRMTEGGGGPEPASPPSGSPKESTSRGSSPPTPITCHSSSTNNSTNSNTTPHATGTTTTTTTTTSSSTTKSTAGATAAEGVKSFSIADILGRDAEANGGRDTSREPSPPPATASLHHHLHHLPAHHPAAHLAVHHHHQHHHSGSTLHQAASKIVRPWDHLRGPIPVRPFLPPALLHYEHRLALDYHQQLQEHFRAQAQLLRHMSMDIIPSESGSERSSSAASDCCSPEIGRGSDHQSHQSSQSSSSGVGGGSGAGVGSGDGSGRGGVNGERGSGGGKGGSGKTAPNGTPLDALFQMTNKNFDETNDDGAPIGRLLVPKPPETTTTTAAHDSVMICFHNVEPSTEVDRHFTPSCVSPGLGSGVSLDHIECSEASQMNLNIGAQFQNWPFRRQNLALAQFSFNERLQKSFDLKKDIVLVVPNESQLESLPKLNSVENRDNASSDSRSSLLRAGVGRAGHNENRHRVGKCRALRAQEKGEGCRAGMYIPSSDPSPECSEGDRVRRPVEAVGFSESLSLRVEKLSGPWVRDEVPGGLHEPEPEDGAVRTTDDGASGPAGTVAIFEG
uniref:Uncharacterized protein n=1 Tax=Anopheles atroparvus TaxID=41427 RepID=A0A182IPR3_ANOAO